MAGLKNLKKRRRVQVIVIGFVALALATGLIGYAMRDGISYFRSPTQVAEEPPEENEVFRMGGLVVDGSMRPGEGFDLYFEVTDGGAVIPVQYSGREPPVLFEEGQGTVATGRLVDGVFVATELLAKHDETYMPAEVIEALKEQGVFVDPETGEGHTDGAAAGG